MKKLFSYLLISSMVILSSCTNYDDQFDDLNNQINSLKSQIEGFSSLSTGLTALQGTVSSLQAAVNALPKTQTPATDISGLEASVAALQAQLANAATSAQVAAITADLAATQAALEATIASNATDLTALEAAVAALENTDISTLEAAVAELKTALASAATSAEITALETSIAAAQTAIDALENVDLSDLTASVAALENTDLTAVNTAIAELKASLALLENTDVSGIETSVAALNTLVTATQASIAANATAIGANATSIDSLSASLAALTTTIAELKATLATVSTAEEVSELAADLVAAQADLDVLLAQSSFYTGNLSITNQGELDFANTLGNKINVVQGNVTVTQKADMNAVTLTAVMARIVTVTGDVSYSETVSTTTKSEFANLIGTASMTISHSGDISLPKLVSVTGNLSISGNASDDGANTETVSLPVLTTVTGSMAFSTISKATTFSMPSMVAYDSAITITIDKTGTVDLSKFTNATTVAGEVATAFEKLTVTAATLTAPVYAKGEIDGPELTSVSLPLWQGHKDSEFDKATSVIFPSIKAIATATGAENIYTLTDLAPKADTIHIVGNTFTSTGASPVTYEISVDGSTHLEVDTVILGGTFNEVDLTGNTDLTTLTFDATAEDLIIDGSDLAAIDIDLVSAVNTGTAAEPGKTSVKIQNNPDLLSAIVDGSNGLNELVIYNNAKLASASFPDLVASSGLTPKTTIKDNNFTGVVTFATAASTAGTLASTSGLKALKDYLDDVITNRKASEIMEVILDEGTKVVTSTGDETPLTDYAIVQLDTEVVEVTGAYPAQTEKNAWVLTQTGLTDVNIQVGSDYVFVAADGTRDDLLLPANMGLAALELASSAAVSRASALGLGLSVLQNATIQSMTVSFFASNDSSLYEVENAWKTASSTLIQSNSDEAKLEIGSQWVTATSDDAEGGIAIALVTAWNLKFPDTSSSLFTVANANTSQIVITQANAGSANRPFGQEIKISSRTASSVAGQAAPYLAYTIGKTSSFAASKDTTDNTTVGANIILVLENTSGLADFPGATLTSTTGIVSLPLISNLDYADPSTYDIGMEGSTNVADVFEDEARGIVREYSLPVDGTEATDGGSNLTTDRTSFL